MSFRLLYLPNEPDEDDPMLRQIGPRYAFEGFQEDGSLSALACFSFLSRFRKSGNAACVKADLLDQIREFQPDVIFWQHVSEFPVDDAFLGSLRRSAPRAVLAYHDPDAFDRWTKPVSGPAKRLIGASDVLILCGLEPMSSLMRSYGATRIRYLPHSYDAFRAGTAWTPTRQRPFDISMIGSRVRRRRPPFYFPGARRRYELARTLSRRFGPAFALYGSGWDGFESARGVIPYQQQEQTLRQSWVSVNWDHFDNVEYYFSDRLPISLAAGVVHVTSAHTGYDRLFRDCPGLYACESVQEVVSCVEWLLARPRRELLEEGSAAQAWAKANLEAGVVYRRALEMCEEVLATRKNGRDAN